MQATRDQSVIARLSTQTVLEPQTGESVPKSVWSPSTHVGVSADQEDTGGRLQPHSSRAWQLDTTALQPQTTSPTTARCSADEVLSKTGSQQHPCCKGPQTPKRSILQVHVDDRQSREIKALKQQIKSQNQELKAARARTESMLQQLINSRCTAQQLRKEIAQMQQQQQYSAIAADITGNQPDHMTALIVQLEKCMKQEQQNKDEQQQQLQQQLHLLEQSSISEEEQVAEYSKLVLHLKEAAEQQFAFEGQLQQATTAVLAES